MKKYCSTKLTEEFLKITKELFNTFSKKNHDYGSSFFVSLDKRGLAAALIRMEDKLNRLDTLITQNEKALVDESIEDTLLDLANYAIMSVVWSKVTEPQAGSDFDIDKNNGRYYTTSSSINDYYKDAVNDNGINGADSTKNLRIPIQIKDTLRAPKNSPYQNYQDQNYQEFLSFLADNQKKTKNSTVTLGVINLTAHKMDKLVVEKSILKDYDCIMKHIKKNLGYNEQDVIDYTILS